MYEIELKSDPNNFAVEWFQLYSVVSSRNKSMNSRNQFKCISDMQIVHAFQTWKW